MGGVQATGGSRSNATGGSPAGGSITTGGLPNAGGTPANTGGAITNTGGTRATGGSSGGPLVTGGTVSATGGTKAATGGAIGMPTGGTLTNGGTATATGGTKAATGGTATNATGGSKAATGGTSAATGGTKATGGSSAAATGGTKTATGGAAAAGGPSGGAPCLTVSGNKIVDSSGKTVILRGVSIEGLYQQSQTSLGLNGIIDKVTNKNDTAGSSPGWYTHIVRLPADPGTSTGSFGANPDGYVNNTLKPIVDYATSKGLYAIIDLHYVDNPYNLVSQVNAFWTKVAPIFANYCNVLYEPFNESNQTDTWAAYKPTMQAWVNLIRQYAPKNIILAGSPSWDQTMGAAATSPLTGGNIAYTVHMYEQHYMSSYNKQQVTQCAAVNPVVMTEWGFNDLASQPGGADLIGTYGTPMLTWLEGMNGGWTAWCASNSWLPEMFTGNNWTLRVGPREMGGFVKDWMYNHQN